MYISCNHFERVLSSQYFALTRSYSRRKNQMYRFPFSWLLHTVWFVADGYLLWIMKVSFPQFIMHVHTSITKQIFDVIEIKWTHDDAKRNERKKMRSQPIVRFNSRSFRRGELLHTICWLKHSFFITFFIVDFVDCCHSPHNANKTQTHLYSNCVDLRSARMAKQIG